MNDLSWWNAFEARVDATGMPSQDPLIIFAMMMRALPEPRPLRREDLEGIKKDMLGDPENRTPIVMGVHTTTGWMNFSFEVDDLEAVTWKELPNLIAFEGPGSFREVVALAKSKYEGRCGHLTPTIQRLPGFLIEDLLDEDVGFPLPPRNRNLSRGPAR